MKKYLLIFSFLLSSTFLNRQSAVSWSLVDENCGINEEEIIKDRMEAQMSDKTKILKKIQDEFLSGAKNNYAEVIKRKIENGEYTSLLRLKGDLASIGYDSDFLGINLNDLNLKSMKLSDVEGLIGGSIKMPDSTFTSFSNNKDIIRQLCKVETIKKCSSTLSSKIDNERLSAALQNCTAERTQGTLEYDTKGESGIDTVGCFVPPGTGMAPPAPMYPFMANNSRTYWTNQNHPGCQCGKYPCPVGTPIVVPHVTADTGAKIDVSKMAGISGCYSEVFGEYTGDIFSRCMTEEEDMCKKNLEQKARDIRETAVDKYKESGEKCLIQKEAFEKSFKDDVKRKLEGTKTPNGTIIKDGKIIHDPNSSKGDKEFIFQLDNRDLTKVSAVMSQCKENLPKIESPETLKRMNEWCENYTNSVTTPEGLDKWLETELNNLPFEKLFYLKMWKLDMISKTDEPRRNIIRDKYMENYEYDMHKVLQYAEEAPEILASVREIQKMMSIEYEREYSKFKIIIDQRYKEYTDEQNRITKDEEEKRRREEAAFEIKQKEEREKKSQIKKLTDKEKEKLILQEIEKLKNNKKD